MSKDTRNFTGGIMNKIVDERLIPNGQYIDALNVRMGSTEASEVGVIENTKGNTRLTSLTYTDGTPLSADAKCIGATKDSARGILYWFIHDPNFTDSITGKLDMIVSYNVNTTKITYHVISVKDVNSLYETTLNFNPEYVITGVNLIDNLLFFTDDYNPPRYINIKRSYGAPISYVDTFTASDINVIKKFPTESPEISYVQIDGDENYIEDKFLCFAYRYRYADGQYSATSQFSEPAFVPNFFNFTTENYLNEGMTNAYNGINITYNSGGADVVGIDLLFKQMSSNIINVIEKINKVDSGLADNTSYQYNFANNKIYTILPETEILRLYDNVPLKSKAQTIMGNRLVYGNYLEGYDLLDINNFPVQLDYFTELISDQVGLQTLPNSKSSGSYTLGGSTYSIPNSIINIDLSGVDLIEGSQITIDMELNHYAFHGTAPYPSDTTTGLFVSFTYTLNQDYSSVYDLATSQEFIDAVGTSSNIKPVYDPINPTSCDGNTFTDTANCLIPTLLGSMTKYDSIIDGASQPIRISATPSSDIISFQVTAMTYVNNPTTPTQYVYEVYEVTTLESNYSKRGGARSLHSNRDYEVGIVYMDEYGRSTTALVSNNDTVHIPCGNSSNQNQIQVTIPATQRAPWWATRYKFVIKPNEEGGDTIYSNVFFVDPATNDAFFLLEGENAKKVQVGDDLVVKADVSGPLKKCVSATVLEKASKSSGFIIPTSGANVPAGVYMRIKPNDFNVVNTKDAYISSGTIKRDTYNNRDTSLYDGNKFWSLLAYPMNLFTGSVTGYKDYTIPEGSIIKFKIKFTRNGTGDGNNKCEKRNYTYDKRFVSSANYTNMYDWFVGDNVAATINSGIQDVGSGGTPIKNVFLPSISSAVFPSYDDPTIYVQDITNNPSDTTNYWQFWRDPSPSVGDGKLTLLLTGTNKCSGVGGKENRASGIECIVEVNRALSLCVFESQGEKSSPDLFYENDLSFEINSSGEHMGNVQDQDITSNTPAIINTGFFNCFSFGNGVESYRIRDSIVGDYIKLGNRVTTISNQDYKAANRFADLTYSGIYNNESNINKLNEFNLGLVNFKQLERSFGPIQILDARKTDILVLQENKISYVLADKNLLSDAGGGSTLTSIPEVLGLQIARAEEFGISYNPESYVHWGTSRYFTDANRASVIKLSDENDGMGSLEVISDAYMRTWFRYLFNEYGQKQKLGAFDPYLNEYVLSSTDTNTPVLTTCLDCGIHQTLTVQGGTSTEYCVNLGQRVGDVTISCGLIDSEVGPTFYDVYATYNGTTYSLLGQTSSNTFTFPKDISSVNTVEIQIYASGRVLLDMNVGCPVPQTLTIISVCLNNSPESGNLIHNEYRYNVGTYNSPTQSTQVQFLAGTNNPLVCYFNGITGYQGQGSMPTDGSTITMLSTSIGTDTYTFDESRDSMMYLRTNTLYSNTQSSILNLLNAATTISPYSHVSNSSYGTFTMPSTGDYLYLIWDYRAAYSMPLCKGTTVNDVSCNCNACRSTCSTWQISNTSGSSATISYVDCSSLGQSIIVPSGTNQNICTSALPTVVSGTATLTSIQCGCHP